MGNIDVEFQMKNMKRKQEGPWEMFQQLKVNIEKYLKILNINRLLRCLMTEGKEIDESRNMYCVGEGEWMNWYINSTDYIFYTLDVSYILFCVKIYVFQ